MFIIVITLFEIIDMKKKSEFFEKTYQQANFSINIVSRKSLFILSNIEINFLELEFFFYYRDYSKY